MQRAVDEIYRTCEEDENVSECKEVILVLENYTRDFHNLIEWFKVKWAYESTVPPLRRTPLAWEVRKTSPCRLWNSTPKPSSPLQRSSPTGSSCKSPIETSFDSRSVSSDGKINSIQEEPDKTNNESTENKKNLQEKRKVPLNKSSDTASNEKPLMSKVASKPPLKRPTAIKLNESITDSKPQKENEKNNTDTKNLPKQSRNCQSLNRVKTTNNESTDNKNSINEKGNLGSDKNSETVKNEINTNINESYSGKCNGIVKRNNPENESEMNNSDEKRNVEKTLPRENPQVVWKRAVKPEIKKQSSIESRENSRSKVTNKSTVAASNLAANKTRIKPTPQTASPANSAVSRARPASTKSTQNLPEVPRMIRSKTTLCARGASNTNQFRSGTSVIVRRHLQSLPANQVYRDFFIKQL